MLRLMVDADLGVVEPFRTLGPGEYVAAYRPPSALEAGPRGIDGTLSVGIRVVVQRLPGDEPPAIIELTAERVVVQGAGEPRSVFAQVSDRAGAPVKGALLHARVIEGDGSISERQETDAEGRAGFRYVPGRALGPVRIEVSMEGQGRLEDRILLLQSSRVLEEDSGADWPGVARSSRIAELTAQTRVSLSAGRVKEIQISALPNTLYLNNRQSSQIRVRLEDSVGNFVVDPSLRFLVTTGTLSPVRLDADGYYVAQYSPPTVGGPMSRAKITVTNPQREYVGSTELQLIRRDAPRMIAVRMGLISNLRSLFSPLFTLQAVEQLKWYRPHFYVGASIGYYYFGADRVRYDLMPFQIFASYRYQVGRFSPYASLGPIFAPVVLSQEYLSGVPGRGLGLFPGFGGMLGVEMGIGPGGVLLEAGASLVRGGYLLDETFANDDGFGGFSVQMGYSGHF